MHNRSRKEGKHDDNEGEAEDPPGDGREEPGADQGTHRVGKEDRVMQTAGGFGSRHFPLIELYCYDRIEEKEGTHMKKYIIKPESLEFFGPEANPYTVITEDDVARIAEDWEKTEDEVLEHLIEDDSDKHAWRLLYRFAGNRMGREQINRCISFDSGDPEEFFKTDEEYRKAIEDGFVKWDWYYTTVWVDG